MIMNTNQQRPVLSALAMAVNKTTSRMSGLLANMKNQNKNPTNNNNNTSQRVARLRVLADNALGHFLGRLNTFLFHDDQATTRPTVAAPKMRTLVTLLAESEGAAALGELPRYCQQHRTGKTVCVLPAIHEDLTTVVCGDDEVRFTRERMNRFLHLQAMMDCFDDDDQSDTDSDNDDGEDEEEEEQVQDEDVEEQAECVADGDVHTTPMDEQDAADDDTESDMAVDSDHDRARSDDSRDGSSGGEYATGEVDNDDDDNCDDQPEVVNTTLPAPQQQQQRVSVVGLATLPVLVVENSDVGSATIGDQEDVAGHHALLWELDVSAGNDQQEDTTSELSTVTSVGSESATSTVTVAETSTNTPNSIDRCRRRRRRDGDGEFSHIAPRVDSHNYSQSTHKRPSSGIPTKSHLPKTPLRASYTHIPAKTDSYNGGSGVPLASATAATRTKRSTPLLTDTAIRQANAAMRQRLAAISAKTNSNNGMRRCC